MADASVTAHLRSLYRKFIDGSHILHHHGVLDAYGHLSFRHPLKPDVFVMSRSIAPALIASLDDLVEYRVSDAEPVRPDPLKTGFAERHIHSEIYRRHNHINAAVHSHAEAVIPYTITGVPLKACYHMAGFLGAAGVPVYDISAFYGPGDTQDMLVRNHHLGAPLASLFDNGNAVALMRGHGFTAVAESIESAVFRAIYTQKNAAIQSSTMGMLAAAKSMRLLPEEEEEPGIRFLSEEEAHTTTGMTEWSVQRPWALWVKEVSASELYVNSADCVHE
ncbi:class II aldolase and Adducin N-terminal domain-containing protein [Podospora appendiculata]|uniref:Class II aldolase and Adducin N-terminal domain-containing protein n=1 Tax=Podospora appendiculata TaxID=314037 RepID=A0AAE1CBM3_9PEZI|nr:class II aldolase and Adducin N-terminal domain-containing protein [Podospora appendiculata]